ncbi:unnamed protein product [Fraxinus pennsylvanica]|uniref:non-specific serine/threonine protein kinase n=1 Tax=Fraxinus pennsylvanica TaxID=56036 RepID=A0AAD2DLU5_9LAMI|nr:unnamed protein product [Fraxinus pennsylvanica]
MASSELDSKRWKREIRVVSFSLGMGMILLSLILYIRRRKKSNQRLRGGGLGRIFADNHNDESHKKDIELPLSLDLILFDPVKSAVLDWPKRFHIINGIARGLMYLHQDSRLRIIHRDLKASNILLDSDMNPKISDFGLARSFGGNETGANTSRVVGTYGYMSPEYAADGLFSVKSDVFSFGVLVLEIVSGRRNRGFSHTDHHYNLLGHAWRLYKEGRSLELVQAYLGVSGNLSEVLRLIHVGLLCVQQCPEDRPNMSSVVLMLGNDGVLPHAKKPGFFTERDLFTAESSTRTNAASSINEVTITLLEAR